MVPLTSPAMHWWLKIPGDTLWCPMAPIDALVPEGAQSYPRVPEVAPKCPKLPEVARSCPQVPEDALRCPPLVSIGRRCARREPHTAPVPQPRVSKSLQIPSAITTFYTPPSPSTSISCHPCSGTLRLLETRESPHQHQLALSTFRILSSILPLFALCVPSSK